MTNTVINVKNLSKKYELFKKKAGLLNTAKALFHRKKEFAEAVSDISFDIHKGEIVGFLGPNGAGKTTTLKMLSGILYPTSGHIDVLGYRPQDRKNAFKRQFGMVMGQKNQLTSELTLMDNLLLFKEFYDTPQVAFETNMKELIEALNLQELTDVPVRKLSLGQRMKCELVAALLHNPEVLFLDEPTIGLDVVAQKNIRSFIKKYNEKKQTTILLTSHYMDDIRELCERVIIINRGKIIYDGKLSALISKYAKDKIIQVTTTQPIAKRDLEIFGVVEEFEGIKATIRVRREDVKQIAASIITSKLPIDDITIEEMPIDDIIREIFEGR